MTRAFIQWFSFYLEVYYNDDWTAAYLGDHKGIDVNSNFFSVVR